MMMGPIPGKYNEDQFRKIVWHRYHCRSLYYKCLNILNRVDREFGHTVNNLTVDNLKLDIVKQVCWCTKIDNSREENHNKEEEDVYGIVWYTQPSHYHPLNHPATCVKVNMVVSAEGFLESLESVHQVRLSVEKNSGSRYYKKRKRQSDVLGDLFIFPGKQDQQKINVLFWRRDSVQNNGGDGRETEERDREEQDERQ